MRRSTVSIIILIGIIISFLGTLCAITNGEPEGQSGCISLDKTEYLRGEQMRVTWVGSSGYTDNAWISIIPSSAPHTEEGADAVNGAWEYIGKKSGGTSTYSAPEMLGPYDFRMFDGDDPNTAKEICSVPFTVIPRPPGPSNCITLNKASYLRGEPMIVSWIGSSTYADNAWISIIPSSAPHTEEGADDVNLAWEQIGKKPGGTSNYTAPDTLGSYDFRMFDGDDAGKSAEICSVTFNVVPRQPGPANCITLDKTSYLPNEKMKVTWIGDPSFSDNAWISIIPSDAPHTEDGADAVNGAWEYIGKKPGGISEYTAPGTPGSYDFRMFDGDAPEKSIEICSVSFTVLSSEPAVEVTSPPPPSVVPVSPAPTAIPPGGDAGFWINNHKYQWSNWNLAVVQNGPPVIRTAFTIKNPVSVTYLDSYHWNNGQGVTHPISLTLAGDKGIEYGPFELTGSEGMGGVKDAIWSRGFDSGVLVLPAGTYEVIDSDPSTWSNNPQSDYAGFFGINWEPITGTDPTVLPNPSDGENPGFWINNHEYQWSNWNIAVVQNGPPSKKTNFVIKNPVSVTYIDSYHWNNGQGVRYPISLTFARDDGTEYGPFELMGSEGMGGVKDAIWSRGFDSGELVLPAGTYEVIDSDPSTWSHNAQSENAGFFGINWKPVSGIVPTNQPNQPTGKLHADWIAYDANVPAPAKVRFYDASPGHDDGTITRHLWDFGDGQTSEEIDPAHNFENGGNYTVTMTIFSGNIQDSKTGTVEIYNTVKADFTADILTGTPPLTVHFTDLSTGEKTREWNFYGQERSTEKNPVYTFNFAGIYSPRLDVWGPGGSDHLIKTDYIVLSPRVDFNADVTEGNASLKVSFTPNASYSTDRGQPTFTWDFGDGSSSMELFPTHTYTQAGTYAVTLTIKGVEGTGLKTKKDFITVKPRAHYLPDPQYGWAPLTVRFKDYSTGEPDSYEYNFDDGTTSTEKDPEHTYNKAGAYVPSLTIKKDDFTDTLNMIGVCCSPGSYHNGQIIVMPVANFTPSVTSGSAPLTVSFTDMSQGSPDEISWTFGDGVGTSTEKNPSYTFNSAGTYTVVQKVQTGELVHTKSITIVVKESTAPVFTIKSSSGNGGTINPTGDVSVVRGKDQSFSFTPDIGYALDELIVDGDPIDTPGNSYTFSQVNKAYIIAVTFKPEIVPPPPSPVFTIKSSSGSGGIITPAGEVSVPGGKDQKFSFTPDAGYMLDVLTVDGKTVTNPGNSYTFSQVNKAHIIAVTFKPEIVTPPPSPVFIISSSSGKGGAIAPAGEVSVIKGEDQKFSFTADSGYILDVLKVDGKTIDNPGNSYTFSQVNKAHIIAVTFRKSGDSGNGEYSTIEQTVVDLINQERTSRGLTPYVRDPFLDKVSQYHTNTGITKGWREGKDCAKGNWKGACAHLDWDNRVPDDRATLLGYPIPVHKLEGGCNMSYIGENCYQMSGYPDSEVPGIAVDGWMQSPGHRAAILDHPAIDNGNSACACNNKKVSCTFTKIGINVGKTADGTWYLTTNFA